MYLVSPQPPAHKQAFHSRGLFFFFLFLSTGVVLPTPPALIMDLTTLRRTQTPRVQRG